MNISLKRRKCIDMKEKRHWFLKYPLLPAFLLPLVGVIGASLLVKLLTMVLPALFGDGIKQVQEFPSLANDILRILFAVTFILVMKYSSKGTFRFGFSAKNLWLSIGLSLSALLTTLDNVVESSLAGLPLQSTFYGVLLAVLSGIGPGVFEEVACRGVVLSNMMERWNRKKGYILKSVLTSGIAFGLLHLINLASGDVGGTLLQVGYASGLGIFFGSVYARTRNLWGPVIIHSLIDFSSFIYVGESETTALTVAVGIVITVAYTLGGLYLIRPKKQEEIRALWETAEESQPAQD